MRKTKMICCLAGLILSINVFGSTSIRANKSILCEDKQGDGATMVEGLHNPYSMRGYIFSELPIDNIVGKVHKEYVKPHMQSFCNNTTETHAGNVLIHLQQVCSEGCLTASESDEFNELWPYQRQKLAGKCQSNCARSWSELLHYIKGYERALNTRQR